MNGKKVLHMDRNPYYGGESSSITPLEEVTGPSKPSGLELGPHHWLEYGEERVHTGGR